MAADIGLEYQTETMSVEFVCSKVTIFHILDFGRKTLYAIYLGNREL